MVGAKEIVIKVIPSKIANDFVKRWHYSGKIVNNSKLHFGAFLNNILHGVMSFGSSLDKRKIQGLVKGTLWNEFLELNRMAFDNILPRNSESRCLSIAFRLIRKNAPHIKWIVSFADGTQCGDGTIYRASGFVLTGIKENDQIWRLPDGYIFNDTSIRPGIGGAKAFGQVASRVTLTKGKHIANTGASSMKQFKEAGAEPMKGFQLRYLYFLDPTARDRLTVPILPFSEIDKRGAKMYLGKRPASIDSDAPGIPAGNKAAQIRPQGSNILELVNA